MAPAETISVDRLSQLIAAAEQQMARNPTPYVAVTPRPMPRHPAYSLGIIDDLAETGTVEYATESPKPARVVKKTGFAKFVSSMEERSKRGVLTRASSDVGGAV
jgi:hypothetical protein